MDAARDGGGVTGDTMRVESFLENTAARLPDKVALVVGEQRLTYARLDAQATHLARALANRGARPGDRVVVFLDNSAEAVVGVFGALKAGAAFVLVNPSTKADKLAYALNNCAATAVITHARLLPVAAAAVERSPTVTFATVVGANAAPAVRGGVAWDALLAEGQSAHAAPAAAVDPYGESPLAQIGYTSGSTGSPKGVMLSHANIAAVVGSVTRYLENTADDVILSVLPLSFGYGLNQVFTAFSVGATVVLERSFAYPAHVLQKMAAENATGFPLVPTIAATLLQQQNLHATHVARLRYITNAAAALPRAHVERLTELLPAVRLFSMYGQTECTRATYLPPEQLMARPESVGIAIPGTELCIVDEGGRRVGPGETGELVVRGPHVMMGYWGDDAATERSLRRCPATGERVLHTNDLFRTDDDGYFYFVSRRDDIIKTGGQKVSPKEVEGVLYALPGVAEAAVVGVPHPTLGQAVRAVVVKSPEASLTEREVIMHCARSLEDYMVPKAVEFRQALPKTDSGKIRRSEVQAEFLREQVAAGA